MKLEMHKIIKAKDNQNTLKKYLPVLNYPLQIQHQLLKSVVTLIVGLAATSLKIKQIQIR